MAAPDPQCAAVRPVTEAYTVIRLSTVPVPDAESNIHVDENDDVVFLPQRSTQDSLDLMHAAIVLEFNSFDGGERFGGCLREGGPEPVPLFSRQCIGLALSAAVAGFCVAFFASAFRPLFITGYLTTYHGSLVATTNSLLQWPPVLSLFIGVLSDAIPLRGCHRKPYLIGGWLIASFASAAAGILSHSADLASTKTAVALLLFSVAASFGIQIVWVISLAITVQHAQREAAQARGHFQGALFLVYYSATAATHVLCTRMLVTTNENGSVEAMISLQETVVVLAVCAFIPIPFIIVWYHEHRGEIERDTATKFSSVGLNASFWSHLHQKPVHRIYFFLCGVAFLVNARNDSVDAGILSWCGIAKHKFGNLKVAQATPKVVAVIVWKWFMLNADWRVLGVAGLVLHGLCRLALVLISGLDVTRGEWLYYWWTAIASIPLGWVEVFMVILPTEVAGVGCEGLAMGLVASFMALIAIMTTTLWDSINAATGLTFSPEEIVQDAMATRHRLVLVGVAYVVLNVSSVALAPLLPPQKREAQRWRLFGRVNRPAGRSLAGALALLVLYNLAANWLQVRGH